MDGERRGVEGLRKVRFVPSFGVITLWPSLPQIQYALP